MKRPRPRAVSDEPVIFFSFSISFKSSRFVGCANPQRSSWSQNCTDPLATEAEWPDWNLISNCGLLTRNVKRTHVYVKCLRPGQIPVPQAILEEFRGLRGNVLTVMRVPSQASCGLSAET